MHAAHFVAQLLNNQAEHAGDDASVAQVTNIPTGRSRCAVMELFHPMRVQARTGKTRRTAMSLHRYQYTLFPQPLCARTHGIKFAAAWPCGREAGCVSWDDTTVHQLVPGTHYCAPVNDSWRSVQVIKSRTTTVPISRGSYIPRCMGAYKQREIYGPGGGDVRCSVGKRLYGNRTNSLNINNKNTGWLYVTSQ